MSKSYLLGVTSHHCHGCINYKMIKDQGGQPGGTAGVSVTQKGLIPTSYTK
jgi:hypothetical protein